ncbi:MAG: UDP-2,4-diacetamido-2,4,6-trideoxy-beta-L-altropyranose hydrolase [Candidatus Sericytochromatia bacterium]|nr:UDP-2,4-diacetamido-2,4,6-trideoxy-beta-L-altropyranose hydrolase [Candidatus Sericytochromatia bacterium]
MKVIFRVDASEKMGTGHFMRCLTLAEGIRQQGGDVSFICREHPGNLIQLLQSTDFPHVVLPAPATELSLEGYTNWLGVSQTQDAEETIQAMGADFPDWLIADHYALDHTWQSKIRSVVGKIMMIDDLANRQHDCDLLLDQNLFENGDSRYQGKVPADCELCLGPAYALLRPEYAQLLRMRAPRNGDIQRILVFFGGSDAQDMTGLCFEVLSEDIFASLSVDLVVGANYLHRKKLENKATLRPGTRIFGFRPHLADLMSEADLAIGAGGATLWERMCMGLPSVVISLAENQVLLAQHLAKQQWIKYLGPAEAFQPEALRNAIQTYGQKAEYLRISAENQKLCDGLGVKKIIQKLQNKSDSIYKSEEP